jgi:NAD(P)-dependent dehydrogenase (short-subunit alcohol dehydrogenase family)
MEIRDTTAVVTGAASGLGAATAARLIELGASVFGFDTATAVQAAAPQPGLRLLPVDVTDPDAVRTGIAEASAQPDPLRIVVNCAGIAPSARIVSSHGMHDLDLFATVVRVNLIGTFTVLALAADRITRLDPDPGGQRGVIVNTASIAGYEGQVGQAAYASSKAGVIGLTIAAARDLAQYGIRVTTIAPGIMETPMLAGFHEDVRKSLAATVPFPGRLGLADEFAQLVAFLIEHDYMNGEVVRMDGGLRMAAR